MYEILGLKHVFSTFQETVWSHLKRQFNSMIQVLFDKLTQFDSFRLLRVLL